MSQNIDVFIAGLSIDIYNELKKQQIPLSNKIDEITQQAIVDMDIPDLGLLQAKTLTQFFVNSNSNVIAEVKFITKGIDYQFFVHEGLGTNARYGRRNYLEVARKQTIDFLTKGSYTRVFKKGSLNKKRNRLF